MKFAPNSAKNNTHFLRVVLNKCEFLSAIGSKSDQSGAVFIELDRIRPSLEFSKCQILRL